MVSLFSVNEGKYYEMCSFPETKAERYASRSKCQTLVDFNRRQFSRVYPKGQRIDSSNYEPTLLWNCGCHMLAINYQTPGKLFPDWTNHWQSYCQITGQITDHHDVKHWSLCGQITDHHVVEPQDKSQIPDHYVVKSLAIYSNRNTPDL